MHAVMHLSFVTDTEEKEGKKMIIDNYFETFIIQKISTPHTTRTRTVFFSELKRGKFAERI